MVDTRSTLLAGLRYIVVGVATVAVYIGLSALLHYGLAVPALVANAIGYVTSAALNYIGHYYWSFETTRTHAQASWRYLAVLGAGIALNSLFVAVMLRTTALPLEAIGLIYSVLWPFASFVGLRFWAMR
jgi:putative flippase GtrA